MDTDEHGRVMQQTRDEAERLANGILASIATLSQPLKTLTEVQRASVNGLLLALDAARLLSHPALNVDPDLLLMLHEAIAPGRPVGPSSRQSLCMDESVAYAMAMARCRQGNPPRYDELDCFEAWGPAAATTKCMFATLNNHQIALDRLLDVFDGKTHLP